VSIRGWLRVNQKKKERRKNGQGSGYKKHRRKEEKWERKGKTDRREKKKGRLNQTHFY